MKVNAFLLILGRVISELAPFMEWYQPSLKKVKIHPFINYTWPWDPKGYPLLWWVKECTNDFMWIITMFVLCRIAEKYSFRMFTIAGLWFMYHIFDAFMLWYNYRQSEWTYIVAVSLITATTVLLFLPERKTGQVKSIN